MANITKKSEIVELIAEKSGFTKKDSATMYEALVEVVAEGLEGLELEENLTLPKICKFSAIRRDARVGRNPQNPEQELQIPSSKRLKITTFPSLKEMVKEIL